MPFAMKEEVDSFWNGGIASLHEIGGIFAKGGRRTEDEIYRCLYIKY